MISSTTKIIGVTGGIAAGKSASTNIIRELGHVVICADDIARQLTDPDGAAYPMVLRLFGKEFLKPDLSLNRPMMASVVFKQAQTRKRLESILHPLVRAEIIKLIEQQKKLGTKLVFLDIPLLFESNMDRLCDLTVCIATPQYLQLLRLKKYRSMRASEALRRIRAQMPLREKKLRADVVIDNRGTLSMLRKKWQRLCQEFGSNE